MTHKTQRSVLRIPVLVAVMAAGLFASSTAFAKEGDVEACAGLEAGDGCVRADGDPGVCQPDASDPNVLKCDDDAYSGGAGNSSGDDSSSSDDGSIECSLNSGAVAPDAALAFTLVGAFLALRRTRRGLR